MEPLVRVHYVCTHSGGYQPLWQVLNGNAPSALIKMRRKYLGLSLEIPMTRDGPVSFAITCIFNQVMKLYQQRKNCFQEAAYNQKLIIHWVCLWPFYTNVLGGWIRYGAHVGGPKSNTCNLIVRQYAHLKNMFLYFLTYNKWETKHTTQTCNKHHHHGNWAACPSSGVQCGFDESTPPKGWVALSIYCPRPLLKDYTRFTKLM